MSALHRLEHHRTLERRFRREWFNAQPIGVRERGLIVRRTVTYQVVAAVGSKAYGAEGESRAEAWNNVLSCLAIAKWQREADAREREDEQAHRALYEGRVP